MPFTPPATPASLGNDGYLGIFNLLLGSPPAASQIAEIKSITFTPIDVPEVPLTNLTSPNATEEFAPGLIKPGKVSMTGNFTGVASQLQISTLAQGQTEFAFNAELPVQKKTKTYTFASNGYIAHYEVGPIEDNKAMEFKVDIQIQGAYTEAVA
jgi:hypothetical protein